MLPLVLPSNRCQPQQLGEMLCYAVDGVQAAFGDPRTSSGAVQSAAKTLKMFGSGTACFANSLKCVKYRVMPAVCALRRSGSRRMDALETSTLEGLEERASGPDDGKRRTTH